MAIDSQHCHLGNGLFCFGSVITEFYADIVLIESQIPERLILLRGLLKVSLALIVYSGELFQPRTVLTKREIL